MFGKTEVKTMTEDPERESMKTVGCHSDAGSNPAPSTLSVQDLFVCRKKTKIAKEQKNIRLTASFVKL